MPRNASVGGTRRTQGRVMTVAHRGASGSAPESTEAAIRRALAVRVEMIELDVQLTRDERLVIFHDDDLGRTTNGAGYVAAWRARELLRLDCGSWYAPGFRGARMLLASQALRMIAPHCLVNLELKRTARPAVVVRRLVECLRRTGTMRRVLVSSFDVGLLRCLKTVHPGSARALICSRPQRGLVRQAVQLGCVAVHPHKALLTRALLREAHAAGLAVHTWVVNRVGEARRLVRLGVDGIVTNVPEQIRPVCRSAAR